MIFPISNFIKISKVDLVINVHNIPLPSHLSGKKEYPITVRNHFTYSYDSPIPLSEISLSDFELESSEKMNGDMENEYTPLLKSDNLRIGYDGRYYGLYSLENEKYISFNILILNNFEVRKEEDIYSVYFEFTISDSVTLFNPSNNRIPKMVHSSYETIVSDKTQDEIEEEVFEETTNTINSIKIDGSDEIDTLMNGFNLKNKENNNE